MSTALGQALAKSGITIDAVGLIPQQLKNQKPSIIEAAKSGYVSGKTYRKTKVRECPYAPDTREYRFWCRGFDDGMKDSKSNK
jgi:hypothetical protein